MKIFPKYSAALMAILVLTMSSCTKDKYANHRYWVSWGDVRVEGESFSILLDDGKTLDIIESVVPLHEIIDGERVLANYIILESGTNNYDIRLNALGKISVKEPLYKSELSEQELEEIGSDPLMIPQQPWFGGDKYMNVLFEFRYAYLNITHKINLLIDDVNSTDSEIFAELRHDASGDNQALTGEARVSFLVDGLIPEGRNEIKVTIGWADYDGRLHSESIILRKAPVSSSYTIQRVETEYLKGALPIL